MAVFRKMTEKDIPYIAEIEGKTFSDAWSASGIRETFCQKQAIVTVAEMDNRVVGYCIVYYVLDEVEIARVAVDDKVRRQGIGRGLLDYTVACCQEQQITRMLLDVRESNEDAIAFYRKYGFSEDGIRKGFYDRPKEHAILMSKTWN